MTVFDVDEIKEVINGVDDCNDKTYAIALLEWAIDKRSFEAVQIEKLQELELVLENIKIEIAEQIEIYNKDSDDFGIVYGLKFAQTIINRYTNEGGMNEI